MSIEVHVGDTGTIFTATLTDSGSLVDLSDATSLKMIFRKPSGACLEKTAALLTDGTDGVMKYTSGSTDLDVAGMWALQCEVGYANGAWHSNFAFFPVHANLLA